jgi:hypothetical protein
VPTFAAPEHLTTAAVGHDVLPTTGADTTALIVAATIVTAAGVAAIAAS